MPNELATTDWATDGSHVWPLGDLRPHQIDNPDCACGTFFVDHILVHNAFDGREQYERGERKMS